MLTATKNNKRKIPEGKTMFGFIIALGYVLSYVKWGDKKLFKEHYSTVLYVITIDLVYNVLFYDYSLWEYAGLHIISNFIFMFIVYPCAINLFLQYYPKGFLKGAFYILLWTTGNFILEYISVRTGGLLRYHGWNLLWSIGVFLAGFTLIRIHTKHSYIVWPISAFIFALAGLIFKLPLNSLK